MWSRRAAVASPLLPTTPPPCLMTLERPGSASYLSSRDPRSSDPRRFLRRQRSLQPSAPARRAAHPRAGAQARRLEPDSATRSCAPGAAIDFPELGVAVQHPKLDNRRIAPGRCRRVRDRPCRPTRARSALEPTAYQRSDDEFYGRRSPSPSAAFRQCKPLTNHRERSRRTAAQWFPFS